MDTINPTAEQPEHAETSHQKKNIAALSSHVYTMKWRKDQKTFIFKINLLYERESLHQLPI